jgi:hypothetical protein
MCVTMGPNFLMSFRHECAVRSAQITCHCPVKSLFRNAKRYKPAILVRNIGRGEIVHDALRIMSFLLLLALCALASVPLFAQTDTATLSGAITDPNGRAVPDTEVAVTRIETGTVVTTKTNGAGIYVFTGLIPGHYHLMIHKPGFKEIAIKELDLHVQDKLEQNFSLEIGSVSETVTVTANGLSVNTTDGSVSTVVDHTYVENMPLNGRSLQDLILLTPGVVTNSPQGGGATIGASGEFSVNGQRTESNYYTVDGVSANVGIYPVGVAPGISGSLPVSTAAGTTQALVSVDALEEFRIQSSTYSAEYGRNPGGQISFVTRSGTNQWHGSAFDYLRNDVFDANDWFNDYYGLPESPERQNDFGGTLGGPVEIPHLYNGKDKTFFFFSYEGLRLIQPQEASPALVPTLDLRTSASSALQPVLNAFSLPCAVSTPHCNSDFGNGFGQFLGAWSNPSSIDSTSIRLDHAIRDSLRLFFRFSDTPSTVQTRNVSSPSLDNSTAFTTRTYTFGVTTALSNRLNNEFRLNYTSNSSSYSEAITNFGGAEPVNLFSLQGLTGPSSADAFVQFILDFSGQIAVLSQFGFTGIQKQWNVVDTWALSLGTHQLRFGADYRRLNPAQHLMNPFVKYLYNNEASVQANSVYLGFGQSNAPAFPDYTNFSAFVQDEWKLTRQLSLTMGLRWEVNPAPGAPQGNLPYTLLGNSVTSWTLAPEGTPLWRTSWYNFAPRLGVAYVLQNSTGWDTVVRGGFGVFFDSGQQQGSDGYQGVGFSAMTPFFGSLFGSPASFPVPPAQVTPPIVNPPVPPFNSSVFAFSPHLQLPYTLQWNASIEQSLGKSQALTISYVGATGRRLLEQSQIDASSFNPNLSTVFYTQNGLTSDYDALQVQYQRRLAKGFQALASYTWGHSIDYGSQNASLPYLRGDSDFDVRNNFSSAFSYDLPNAFQNRFARAVLHHWGIDDRFTARTGFPVTLQGAFSTDLATGQNYLSGLDTVPGQPVYIYGAQCAALYDNGLECPGGRAINPAAFANPPIDPTTGNPTRPGDAPRNFVRGFGAWQMDLAVRRDFPINERLHLQFRAEAFNIFNHPNFGNINANYCSLNPVSPDFAPGCTFGQATATLANSLGGLSPLYQMGGPRSMQFALKLIF